MKQHSRLLIHAVAGDEGHAVVLTLTVTSDNTCGEATATATYTINVDALPTASTTGSGTQTVCANSSYTLTGGEATATHGTILLDNKQWLRYHLG
jgi:hypothetical protein